MFHAPLFEFIPLIAGLLNVAVAVIAWRKEAGFKVNRRFAFLCFATAVWNLGSFFEENWARSPESRLLCAQLSHLGAAWAGPLGVHFILRLSRSQNKPWIPLLGLSYAVSGILTILLFTTQAFVAGVEPFRFGHHVVWGPVYPCHLVNILYDYCLMLAMLFFALKGSVSNVDKNRIRYVLVGTVIVTLTTLSNFLPALGISIWTPGHLGTLIFMVLVLVAMYRYRLMNIRLALAKFTLLLVFWLFMGASFTLLSMALKAVYGGARFEAHPVLAGFVTAGLFALLFQGGVWHVLPSIERLIYPLKGDMRRLMKHLDEGVSLAQDAAGVGRALLSATWDALKVPSAAVYLRRGPEARGFYLAGKAGEGNSLTGIPAGSPLCSLRDAAVREELARDVALEQLPVSKRDSTQGLVLALEEAGFEAVVPLMAGNETLGFLAFGRKRFGGVYDPADLETLRHMASRAAVAVANFETFDKMRLREQLAAAGETAAAIAHEIKNPLGVIRGAADKAQGGDPRYLAMIREETGRLDAIVRSFLEFVRPPQVSLETVDTGRLLARCVELFSAEPVSGSFKIIHTPAAAPVYAQIDPDLFKQIFFNLAGNSVEADRNGTLTVSLTREGERVGVLFSDTCGGLPQSTLDKLFRPFHTTKATGTGLGLSTVKKLMESMDGRVQVDSRPGQGTDITLYFSKAEDKS